jgi:translation initiation factor 1 (eIF-1/SUI1)
MSISDIFRINELKANLTQIQGERDSLKKELADYQQVRKERDALKKLVPETDLYRQLKSTISLLEKHKIEIAQQVKNLESEFAKKKQELELVYELQEQELKQ